MQYQIIDKNGTIIAWIDTEKDSILVHSEYTIISGEDLDSTKINGEMKPTIRTIMVYRHSLMSNKHKGNTFSKKFRVPGKEGKVK